MEPLNLNVTSMFAPHVHAGFGLSVSKPFECGPDPACEQAMPHAWHSRCQRHQLSLHLGCFLAVVSQENGQRKAETTEEGTTLSKFIYRLFRCCYFRATAVITRSNSGCTSSTLLCGYCREDGSIQILQTMID